MADQGGPAISAGGSLLEAFLQLSPDPCVVVDAAGTMQAVNRLACDMFGYADGALVGRPIETLVPARFHRVHVGHREGYAAHPDTRPMGVGLELSGVRSDGTEFPVDISLAPFAGEDGERLVVAAVRDVTEQRRQERNAARLAAVVRASDAAIISTDTEQRIDSWNRAAERLFGYPADEIIGRPVSVLVPDDLRAEQQVAYRSVEAGERVDVIDTTRRRQDGSTFPVATTVSAIRDSRGGLVGYCEVLRDHTDRVRIQDALAAAQAERQMLADRERIARDLHDLVIQRVFAAGMGLQGLIALVKDEDIRDRMINIAKELDTAVQEIRTSIFTIRLDADDAGLRAQLLGVGTQMKDALGFRPTFEFRGPIDILSDPDITAHVVAVVREALANTAKHAQALAVRVRVVGNADELKVTVTDDGVGMRGEGRRSGLANLRERAEELGGSFAFDSAPGAGTTLVWSVPL